MKVHCIKILPQYFEKVVDGTKKFEIRKNDRGYCENDVLIMKEWQNGKFFGRQITVEVTYLLEEIEGIEKGYCIMGIEPKWATNKLSTFYPHRGVEN